MCQARPASDHSAAEPPHQESTAGQAPTSSTCSRQLALPAQSLHIYAIDTHQCQSILDLISADQHRPMLSVCPHLSVLVNRVALKGKCHHIHQALP